MHKNILLSVGITILFLGVGFQPAISQPNVKNQLSFEDEEKENIIVNQDSDYFGSLKRKVYTNCWIETNLHGCNGIALLIPGFWTAGLNNRRKVFFNSGIVYNFTKLPYESNADWLGKYDDIFIDGDKYSNWRLIIVLLYTGFLKHYLNYEYTTLFQLEGFAKYAAIYYK